MPTLFRKPSRDRHLEATAPRRQADTPTRLPDGRPLGAHLPLGGGMVKAVDRIVAIGGSALQVFSDNPTAWRRRAAPPAELPAFRARLVECGVGPVAIHAAYLVNLAGPDPELFERSISVLASELGVAGGFGASLVNVHVGSHRCTGVRAGVLRVAEGLGRVLGAVEGGPHSAQLVLENSSGGGFAVGATVEELTEVLEATAARGVDLRRVGICLDTAHLWGAGYDLSDPDAIDVLLARAEALLGHGRIAMVHLNDSKAELGSRADRHEHLGAGRIGQHGLRRLLSHPALAAVPYYLETPGMDEGFDATNVERALRIAAGLSVAPLPRSARAVRGSRARTPPPDDPSP